MVAAAGVAPVRHPNQPESKVAGPAQAFFKVWGKVWTLGVVEFRLLAQIGLALGVWAGLGLVWPRQARFGAMSGGPGRLS